MINYRFLTILLSLIVFYSLSIAQSKTNFELIDSLIHRTANEIVGKIDKDNEYSISFKGADDYSILNSKIAFYLQQKGVTIDSIDSLSANIINYNLEEAKVNYSDVFRDGLFGDFLVKRNAKITGFYLIMINGREVQTNTFKYEIEDSVLYDNINSLENIAYPFTTAEIPDEPFFSSTLEPVIAFGTAAVAIYLFFNIRSK